MKFFIIFAALFAVGSAGLGKDLKPALCALNPTAQAVAAGLHRAAGNVQAAVQNVGVAANDAADAAACVAGNAAAGVGTTVGCAPKAVDETLHLLASGHSPLAGLLKLIFGGSSSHSRS